MKEVEVKVLRLPEAVLLVRKTIGLAVADPADVRVAPFVATLPFPTTLIQGAVVLCCRRASVILALHDVNKRQAFGVGPFCVRIH